MSGGHFSGGYRNGTGFWKNMNKYMTLMHFFIIRLRGLDFDGGPPTIENPAELSGSVWEREDAIHDIFVNVETNNH